MRLSSAPSVSEKLFVPESPSVAMCTRPYRTRLVSYINMTAPFAQILHALPAADVFGERQAQSGVPDLSRSLSHDVHKTNRHHRQRLRCFYLPLPNFLHRVPRPCCCTGPRDVRSVAAMARQQLPRPRVAIHLLAPGEARASQRLLCVKHGLNPQPQAPASLHSVTSVRIWRSCA